MSDNPPHFVVMDKHQIGQLAVGANARTLAEAITRATEKVKLDFHPRYIVQVMCLVESDRTPRVLISPHPDPSAQPAVTRETHNL
ncbi:MAG TPA: hypothetical protein VGC79_10175 [Polyangiaceae bacterium]